MERRKTRWVALLLLVPSAFGVLYFGTPAPGVPGPWTIDSLPDRTARIEEAPLAGIIDTTPSLQEGRGWPFQPLPRVAKKDRPLPPVPVDTVPLVDSIFEAPLPPPRECMTCTPTPQSLPVWVLPPLAAAVLVTRAEVRATIPEPSSLVLVVIGVGLLAAYRTRR